MEQFSVRVNRNQTINGNLLASMELKDAQKHFAKIKGKHKFSEAQIAKAHAEAHKIVKDSKKG